jgi:citrate synthase
MTAGELTTDQVARLLGVKPQTVYAYVSRGMLSRRRADDGRTSLFPAAEVRRLAAKHKRTAPAKGDNTSIQTTLTAIENGRLLYRGIDTAQLAGQVSFEAVANLLWTGQLVDEVVFSAPRRTIDVAEAVIAPLVPVARPVDLLPLIVAAVATGDPLRTDLDAAVVEATGRALISAMVEALPRRSDHLPAGEPPSIAARLWPALTSRAPGAGDVTALDAAMVLLADHELASSTMAARVAASTRSHPYAVVAAGLGTQDGPRHGGVAALAYQFLREAMEADMPLQVFSDHLRAGPVPGFGERFYRESDPRAATLLRTLSGMTPPGRLKSTVDELIEATDRRPKLRPTMDFALAVLAHTFGMSPTAGETIAAIARTAGWIAHALEEYREEPFRFRPRAIYTGIR